MARLVWEKTAADRFPNQLYSLRDKAKKKSGTSDTAQWKAYCPTYMRQDIWDGLCDKWADLRWGHRSSIGVANRKKILDVCAYTGGSISFASHKKKMKEQGGAVSYREVYVGIHKRKGVEKYITKKSGEVMETYDHTMKEKYEEDSIQHLQLDPEDWLTAAGQPKKASQAEGASSFESKMRSMVKSFMKEQILIKLRKFLSEIKTHVASRDLLASQAPPDPSASQASQALQQGDDDI